MEDKSEKRVAMISIIINELQASERVNAILHEFAPYIVGRMGIPYRERNISLISVVIDAANDTINMLTGKLGMIEGIKAKTMFSKL